MPLALQARGLDISDLRARQFGTTDFDLIIVMDSENQAEAEGQRPTGSQTPVHLFTDYARGAEADHVPDPYYSRDFEGCLDLIERAAHRLKTALKFPAS